MIFKVSKLQHRIYGVILLMLNGYTDRDIELSEKIVTRKLTVNSGDFHILNDNFLDLKYDV